MKIVWALTALLLTLTACGDEGGTTATDSGPGRPAEVPAAPGSVTTRGIVTVMDKGGPELCLGAVAESWPPQCGGPAIEGWSWRDHRGLHESEQGVRWGQFVVVGRWDGTALTVESAVPAALYDAMPVEPAAYPPPTVAHSAAELEAIAAEVGTDLPGAQGAYAQDGHVLVDVTYDDGSLQSWVDREYGDGVVVVTPMLLDAEA